MLSLCIPWRRTAGWSLTTTCFNLYRSSLGYCKTWDVHTPHYKQWHVCTISNRKYCILQWPEEDLYRSKHVVLRDHCYDYYVYRSSNTTKRCADKKPTFLLIQQRTTQRDANNEGYVVSLIYASHDTYVCSVPHTGYICLLVKRFECLNVYKNLKVIYDRVKNVKTFDGLNAEY